MHPEFERFGKMSDDERLMGAAIAIAGHFGPQALADFCKGFPEVSGPPGLRVLVAPDGVTVRVLRGDESSFTVRLLVMGDVAGRYVRPEAEAMLAAGKSPGEVDVAAFGILLREKGRYRLELLGEPGGVGR